MQDGEISSAEFLGLIYHDVVVDGIDDAQLYAFSPPEGAWKAPHVYLYAIALAGMNEAQRSAWQALYDNAQYDQAFEYAVSTDEFAAEMRKRLDDPIHIASAETWLEALDALQEQAEAVGAEIPAENQAALEGLKKYLGYVSQRSEAMVQATLALAQAHPEAPLAITIGAMHTEKVVQLLTEAGVSFVVLRPRSLAEGDTAGMLSAEAYRRKEQGLSVAPDGWLGSYLDGREKKPPPVAEKEWYKAKMELSEAIQRLVNICTALFVEEGMTVEEIMERLHADGNDRITTSQGWVVDVISGDAESGTPEFGLSLRSPSGEIYSVSARVIGSQTKAEMKRTIEERLDQARQEIEQEEPPSETQSAEPLPERVCSNTEITQITRAGG